MLKYLLDVYKRQALSLVGVYEEITKNGEVKIVEGSELISSELVKKDSEFDAIIAPINLRCV